MNITTRKPCLAWISPGGGNREPGAGSKDKANVSPSRRLYGAGGQRPMKRGVQMEKWEMRAETLELRG
jgi:hypothetical protein